MEYCIYSTPCSYASLVSPLEDAIKGLQGADSIEWSDALVQAFKESKEALVWTEDLEKVFAAAQEAIKNLDAWTWTGGAEERTGVLEETEMEREVLRESPNLSGSAAPCLRALQPTCSPPGGWQWHYTSLGFLSCD